MGDVLPAGKGSDCRKPKDFFRTRQSAYECSYHKGEGVPKVLGHPFKHEDPLNFQKIQKRS